MAQSQGTTSTPPPEPRVGQDAITYLRTLRQWLARNVITPGAGLTSTQTGSGRVLSLLAVPGGSSSTLPFRIYQAGGSIMTIPMSMAMDGYAPDPDVPSTLNWSLEFAVTSSKLDNYSETDPTPPELPELINPIGTSAMDDEGATPEPNTELYDGDAGKVVAGEPAPISQTYYRIPIIRAGVRVCNGGAYRENIFCAGSRGPIVELIRI